MLFGRPEEIRTPDLKFRKLAFYPTELRAVLVYYILLLKSQLFWNGSSARIRTEISQLSVATEYKPAVLPLNYTAIKFIL